MMLAEEGKLSVSDPITKFLPDYPTQGRTITVEHLLTHTSGIQSYTDMPKWRGMLRQDISLAELVDLFKSEPMQFAPGEKWRYNNSGYILLGAIIEKVSGKKYADFVRERIFDPLGMSQTRYDVTGEVIARRAAGYGKTGDRFVNAQYLSMTQPYAAGALLSTAEAYRVSARMSFASHPTASTSRCCRTSPRPPRMCRRSRARPRPSPSASLSSTRRWWR